MVEHRDHTIITYRTEGPQCSSPDIPPDSGYLAATCRGEATNEPRLSDCIQLKELVEVLASHGLRTDYFRIRRRILAGDIPSYPFGSTRVVSKTDLPKIIAALVRKPEPKQKARTRRLSDSLAG